MNIDLRDKTSPRTITIPAVPKAKIRRGLHNIKIGTLVIGALLMANGTAAALGKDFVSLPTAEAQVKSAQVAEVAQPAKPAPKAATKPKVAAPGKP